MKNEYLEVGDYAFVNQSAHDEKMPKEKIHTLMSADIYLLEDRELTMDELAIVCGGMPTELFEAYRVRLINENW